MIASYYTRNNNISLFFLPFLLVSVGYIAITKPVEYSVPFTNSLLSMITGEIRFSGWLIKTLSFLVILIQSIIANNVFSKHEYLRNSFIVALIYMLSLLINTNIFIGIPELSANLFLLLMFYNAYELSNEEADLNNVFSMGLFLSLASFIYFPSISLFFLPIIAIWYFRAEYIREILIYLSGLIIPYFFFVTYLFWFDMLGTAWEWANTQLFSLKTNISIGREFIPLLVIVGILSLSSLFYMLQRIGSLSIVTRKISNIILWNIFFVILSFFIFKNNGLSHFLLLSFSFAPLLSVFLITRKKKWVTEVYFILLILAIIYCQLNLFVS